MRHALLLALIAGATAAGVAHLLWRAPFLLLEDAYLAHLKKASDEAAFVAAYTRERWSSHSADFYEEQARQTEATYRAHLNERNERRARARRGLP